MKTTTNAGEWFAAGGYSLLHRARQSHRPAGNHEYFEEFEDTPQERRVLGKHLAGHLRVAEQWRASACQYDVLVRLSGPARGGAGWHFGAGSGYRPRPRQAGWRGVPAIASGISWSCTSPCIPCASSATVQCLPARSARYCNGIKSTWCCKGHDPATGAAPMQAHRCRNTSHPSPVQQCCLSPDARR